jgi:PTS system nitrogen regulatory IIA component
MTLGSIIDPELVFCRLDAVSKKRLFEHFSEQAHKVDPDLDSSIVFEGLFTRERLGSTALGKGIAIPHCRIEGSSSAHGALVTLKTPIDFDASDGQPIDVLIFLVVSGDATQEHLNMLATISKALSDEDFCYRIRQCNTDDELANLLHQDETNLIGRETI